MANLCQKCGCTLNAAGHCQACLLNLGISHGAEQSELDQKLAALPSIADLNANFPQLEITRLVGRGGMGAIYHARQTALDRDVALKIIAKEVAGDTAFIERFEREAKTLARLSHPNIVTIFDFGRTVDGQAYLIMEFVDGINLREAMSSGSVGREDSLAIISTVCNALQYAHSKGVVHRDIKPENILLGEDGTIKVADFGIAKIIDNSPGSPALTATRQVLGSLHYLAPEHLESPTQVDHRVDLYALGVVFYELLTGQLPLGRYDPPSMVRPGIDARMDPVVLKALNRKPSQRYQSAVDLEKDLDQLRGPDVVKPLAITDAFSMSHGNTSVPFTQSAFAGFAKVAGMLRSKPGELSIEYQIQDSILGVTRSQPKTISIPVQNLVSLDFIPGIFGSKMVIMTDTISVLNKLPTAESGRVELSIKSADGELATQVVRVLGFAGSQIRGSIAADQNSSCDSVKAHDGWMTFGVFMLFCGIINAGILGIGEYIISDELRDIELVAAAVGAAVLIGPVLATQLFTGLLCIVAKPIGIARAAAIVSMIPVTPGWLLSCPIGIWAHRWLKRGAPTQPPSGMSANADMPIASPSTFWSTTSLFLMPESRWGRRLLAMGNAVLVTFAIATFATFKLGWYPTSMRYRIVASEASPQVVLNRVRQRIKGKGEVVLPFDGSRFVSTDDSAAGDSLEIRITQRHRESIEQMLQIEGDVQMVWLASSSDVGTDSAKKPEHEFDVATGLKLPSEVATNTAAIRSLVFANRPPTIIESSYVSKLSSTRGELTVYLSQQGQTQLLDGRPSEEAFVALGLLVDGIIEGVADSKSVSGRQVRFELSQDFQSSAEAIIAAIRGPVIPTDLELLE